MRTGSSWLCTILDGHPLITCRQELLHRTRYRGRAARAYHYLDRELFRTAPTPVRGFKMLYHQFRGPDSPDCYVFARLFTALYRCRVVHLRRDPLATYASRQLAQRTGLWNVFRRERDVYATTSNRYAPTEAEVARDIADYNRPTTLDLRHLADWCVKLRHWHDKVGELFPGKLELSYEELPDVRKVYDYLGVEPAGAGVGETVRLRQLPLEQLVTNYDAARVIVESLVPALPGRTPGPRPGQS